MTLRQYVLRLRKVLQEDRDFRRLTAVRLALTSANAVSGFYVVFATREVGLGAGAVGGFLSAQVAGGFLASLGLGYLSSRSGNRLTTIVESVLVLVAPILALVLSYTLAASPAVFAVAYAVVFALLGAFQASHLLGHLSYLLEMAPPGERTTYVGLSNTISGLLVMMPMVAGWIVNVSSYQTLFAVSAAVGLLATGFSLRLREPRRAGQARPLAD